MTSTSALIREASLTVKVKLSKEALGSLPAPDSQGLVRVTAALELLPDGQVNIVEINDSPLGDNNDDDAPMPPADLPDLSQAESDIYAMPGR